MKLRSETMGYYHLILPRESSWEVLNELGRLSMLHFVDQNESLSAINRPFTNYVKRCDEVLLKIHSIKQSMKAFGKETTKCPDTKEIMEHFTRTLLQRGKAGNNYFEEIEDIILKKAQQLDQQIGNYTNIKDKNKHMSEFKSVLNRSSKILGPQFFTNKLERLGNGLEDDEENIGQRNMQHLDLNGSQMKEFLFSSQIGGLNESSNMRLHYVVGTIQNKEASLFQKIIFRVTKGNSWVMMDQMQPSGQKGENKTVFLILIPGKESGFISSKIGRICDSFGANRYEFPDSQEKYKKRMESIDQQIKDSKHLLALTKREISEFLESFCNIRQGSNCSYIEELKLYIQKERLIYSTLNLLKAQSTHYHGNCWLPKEREEEAMSALQSIRQRYPHLPNGQLQEINGTKLNPPTHFKLNEFTSPFQLIVSTYGIPRYKEINPGVFTIITFPFLFGVMFGDIGHGFLLFIFGAYLCAFKKTIEHPIIGSKLLQSVLGSRYLILLMGFFATFCGLIYNDFFSLSLNWFGSCYDSPESEIPVSTPANNCVYPFGIDPVWNVAENDLQFLNSFKMKFAVIIAIAHMTLGVILKAANALFFKQRVDFFFEFIPQLCFLLFTFGYMDALIFIKWATNWDFLSSTSSKLSPPSIIAIMIDIPLNNSRPGPVPIYGSGELQQELGKTFLAIAIVCVPLMLFPKPLLKKWQINRRYKGLSNSENDDKRYLMKEDIKSDDAESDQIPQNNSQHMQEIQLDDLGKDLEMFQKKIDLNHNIFADLLGDDSIDSNGEQENKLSDLFVHQIIETIEFVLGSISNTASYLRLWALSLAHSQLAQVFFSKALLPLIEIKDLSQQGNQVVGLLVGYFMFALITFGVLLCMDVMECFLHALRLHWY